MKPRDRDRSRSGRARAARDRPCAGTSSGTRRPRSSTSTRSRAVTRGSPRAGRSSSTPASTRAARRRTSSSSASRAPSRGSGGATSTPRSPRSASSSCARRSQRVWARATSTSSTPSRASDPAHRIAVRVHHREPLARALREDALHRPDRRRARGDGAAGARPPRAVGLGRSGRGRHAHGDVRLSPPVARRGASSAARSTPGEIKKSIFTRHERPPSARGRASRCTARRTSTTTARVAVFFGLSGHREDDALGRSGASPHRRRRARLVRTTASSTSRAAATRR